MSEGAPCSWGHLVPPPPPPLLSYLKPRVPPAHPSPTPHLLCTLPALKQRCPRPMKKRGSSREPAAPRSRQRAGLPMEGFANRLPPSAMSRRTRRSTDVVVLTGPCKSPSRPGRCPRVRGWQHGEEQGVASAQSRGGAERGGDALCP